ncbi:glycerol kinase [Vibrio sp. RM-69-4]|uniref:glycerol kinase n=1 Tax=Vibrio sp. RM-69-4 TaxID=2950157 RepID=UPI00215C2063|nr:glycerol kinase [Vibrio sp. RM-69-4]MCR9421813.1 glycerol kinase [Vibrio sp. RM-69-4]
MVEKHSTSALAKLRNTDAKQLFSNLQKAGYINRFDNKWVLTELGAKFGGEYAQHTQYGQFIVWPENLLVDTQAASGKTLSATQLGDHFRLNPKKINQLLRELGWISKTEKGWQVTEAGLRAGAQQREDKSSEQFFVVWHDTVTRHKRLKQSIVEFLGQEAHSQSTDKSLSHFRQKFEAKHRTLDGHYVRSTGELLIDNWLYLAGVVHAYERQLPIEADVMCDFYLPTGKVYLQYWGSDSGATDEKTRLQTQAIYHDHGFALINIHPQDIAHLDDILPRKLREFGIKAY